MRLGKTGGGNLNVRKKGQIEVYMDGKEMTGSGAGSTGMMLRTEGLVKQYGKRTVVNDVSINVSLMSFS